MSLSTLGTVLPNTSSFDIDWTSLSTLALLLLILTGYGPCAPVISRRRSTQQASLINYRTINLSLPIKVSPYSLSESTPLPSSPWSRWIGVTGPTHLGFPQAMRGSVPRCRSTREYFSEIWISGELDLLRFRVHSLERQGFCPNLQITGSDRSSFPE